MKGLLKDVGDEELCTEMNDVSSSSAESEDDTADDTSEMRKLASNKLKLKQLSSVVPFENMDLFIHYVKSHGSRLKFDVTKYTLLSNQTKRQICNKGEKIVRLFSKCNASIGGSLLTYWIEIIMRHKFLKALFEENQSTVPEKFLALELCDGHISGE